MLKRIVLLLALGAALVGCAGTTSSPAGETVAPIDSAPAVESEAPSESASPS
jgi:hypothetical protein